LTGEFLENQQQQQEKREEKDAAELPGFEEFVPEKPKMR
jgi:hypothetical protein